MYFHIYLSVACVILLNYICDITTVKLGITLIDPKIQQSENYNIKHRMSKN